MFSKDFMYRVVKSPDCVVKSLGDNIHKHGRPLALSVSNRTREQKSMGEKGIFGPNPPFGTGFIPVLLPTIVVINSLPNKSWFLRVCCTSLENAVGKVEIAHDEQFLLFPQFSTLLENFQSFSLNSKLSSAKPLSLDVSEIDVWERVNP